MDSRLKISGMTLVGGKSYVVLKTGGGLSSIQMLDISCRNSYNTDMKAVLSEKGQVTVAKVTPADPLDDLVGILKAPIATDQYIEEIRGKAQ